MASKLDIKLVKPGRYDQWVTALRSQTYPETFHSTEHSDLELGVDLTQLKKWKAGLDKLIVFDLQEEIKKFNKYFVMRPQNGAHVSVGSSTTRPTSKIVKYTSYMNAARVRMLYPYSCCMVGLVCLFVTTHNGLSSTYFTKGRFGTSRR